VSETQTLLSTDIISGNVYVYKSFESTCKVPVQINDSTVFTSKQFYTILCSQL